jgi:DNA polymerase epsilon subunit 1
MRENPFYVDTVRAFRDRRNEYKAHSKRWGGVKRKASDPVEKAEADTKVGGAWGWL